jgi:membrane-associated phospholipid phosphatase
MATANHFMLDVVAGIFVATISLAIVWLWPKLVRRSPAEGGPIADLL